MKLRYISAILFILLLSLPLCATAQEEDEEDEEYVEYYQELIDSIRALITPTTPDSLLAKYYNIIANASGNPDTMIKYGEIASKYCSDKDYLKLVTINYAISNGYNMNGEYKKSLSYLQDALEYAKKINNNELMLSLYQAMSDNYGDLDNIDSAVSYMTKALEMSNRLGDTASIADCYQKLGSMYGEKGLTDEAQQYFRKALILDSLSGNDIQYAMDLFYIVQAIDTDKPDSVQEYFVARDYMTKAVEILDSEKTYQKYLVYYEFANIYIQIAKKTNVNKYADSCLYFYKKAGPLFNNNYTLLSNYRLYKYIYVEYLMYYKKYGEAINVMHELENTFGEDESHAAIATYHSMFKDIYLQLGDYKNAYLHIEKQNEAERKGLNDSVLSALSDVKAQQISMMEKLEREKGEEIHAADKRRLHTLIIALVCGLILVTLVIIYIQRAYNIKRKANKELAEKNNILNSQKVEIMAQRDEIASQRDELAAQRDEIATQKDIITQQWHEVETVNNKLFSSINYAKRIQRAAVSSEDDVRKVFPESFVFYRPRDIVSGDFYRCGKCGRYSVMITADCTGHGIPGAFLSMLGLSALKEYMATEQDAENPGTVLDHIRDFIKTTLSATDNGSNVGDGMDMTVCCYDYEKMELRYAAANQKFYIIRGGEAIKLKGDNMPVGRFYRENPHFATHTIPIQKGDMVYTFSDGIQDQFGGNHNGDKRKFTSLQLLETLLSFADKPAATQCQLLEKAILDWRGNTPQVDDITLVGVRV